MFIALRKRLENREEGFTLIELLVVIIIIGILAAIAIPTFLNQRQKGWESAAKSELRNAAVAQESFFTDNDRYTAVEADLVAEGFNRSPSVTFTPISASTTAYCMSAVHSSGGATFYMTQASGQPTETVCT